MTNNQDKPIRVGSRKSELALIQTKHVISRLQALYPDRKFEIHTMSTIGDRVLNISLPKIGEKSLFTRDLEDALRNGGVDFVVHSLKDLPTALPTGMAIGAVLEREDPRDALVLREEYKRHTIASLPRGSVIGTSSLRRTAQIRRKYPHLIVCDIRGNLNTRLAKLDAPDSKFVGIILAQAGLVRMGWTHRISQILEPVDFLYAVGQGALAVECRANDHEILTMLKSLMCLSTTCRILAERSFLKTLGGGCSAPVAVSTKLKGDVLEVNSNAEVALSITGAVWSLDGSTEICEVLGCSLLDEDNKPKEGEEDTSGDSSNDQPAAKRLRQDESNGNETSNRNSPPVINDDADIESISSRFDVKQLIEKHLDLAKRCPIVGPSVNNNESANSQCGAGDASVLPNHCPLHIDVGQDFMGQCPFVNNETKVSLAHTGKCPLTREEHNVTQNTDEVDRAAPSTSKCPFMSLHANKDGSGDAPSRKPDVIHGKCPFIQKTVQMFDYADEEKPLPSKLSILIEDVDNLLCGMYQHSCYKRELYLRSNELGQQLAEQLIKKGALDVMKVAQAEIHSKA